VLNVLTILTPQLCAARNASCTWIRLGMARRNRPTLASSLRAHSLSLTLAAIVVALVVLYAPAGPGTPLGAFSGNAIADWLGVLAFVIATKYFFEVGSGESRAPRAHLHVRVGRFLVLHSLTIVLTLTAVAWAVAFARSEVESKSGQAVGNIASNWIQLVGLVLITKYASERASKEGH